MAMINAGANGGSVAITAASVPGVRVTAFEPVPTTYALLAANIALNRGRFEFDPLLYQLGLGNGSSSVETLALRANPRYSGLSSFRWKDTSVIEELAEGPGLEVHVLATLHKNQHLFVEGVALLLHSFLAESRADLPHGSLHLLSTNFTNVEQTSRA